ncbi:DUF294 nucleotidyltransferase-like domain-containing protein [Snuella sedimenti]|uniref:CBS domain-containing protein n=1 Tax=Snuella sedimenti TaxID=2798802 RepID=A0A8J7J2P9_9FLAO|nr:DUF294 nucleotidyltransferase-like domain-containing protein [Snuella sedimenti]MBJ6367148.1 CBS domain-containing protein [Snuella sedimenti]
MKNSIAERVCDFLISYPPFDKLNENDLLEIAKEVNIMYLEKGDIVFSKDDTYHNYFYIVRNGAVSLYHRTNDNKMNMVSINDAGDIFGVRPLIIEENYKLTAVANEESIVYGIPIEIFKSVTNNNVKVYKYLITSFASNAYDPYTAEENEKIFIDYLPNQSNDIVFFQTANYTKRPITCTSKTTSQEAAVKMSKHKIGCIIVVNNKKQPVGIITNSDLKNRIATGLFPINTPVANIMTSPVITDRKDITVAQGQLQMIKHSIGHLCITKDGTVNSKLIGVLTHHDILVDLGNNPAFILKEIKRAKRTKTLRSARQKTNSLLKSYLDQNIPLSHILKLVSKINDAVTVRVIELSIDKMPSPPPVKFSWLAIGSQGRNEQLLFTDQDNALVFEDVTEDKYEETQNYFLELSRLITKSLNKIGFEYCEADMMASNPEWCKSLSKWKRQFTDWILNPNEKAILLSSIFFDYSRIYGDKNHEDKLTETIYKTLGNTSLFYSFLGKDALKSPSPLGFFKQFLVEQNGEQKNLFNIKKRALMPLIDAARLLTLSKQIKGVNNTAERYEKLAELEPANKELFESCSYAFKALLKFKTKQGLMHNDSGKFIKLESLSKEEKLKLRRCFKPINEVQESIKLRFSLTNFM